MKQGSHVPPSVTSLNVAPSPLGRERELVIGSENHLIAFRGSESGVSVRICLSFKGPSVTLTLQIPDNSANIQVLITINRYSFEAWSS
jgi:hypothetical protein